MVVDELWQRLLLPFWRKYTLLLIVLPLAIITAVSICSLKFAYDQGFMHGGQEWQALSREVEALKSYHSKLKDEHVQLRKDKINLDNLFISKETLLKDLQAQLAQQQTDNEQLREENELFRHVMGADKAKIGLEISHFKIFPTVVDRTFHYEFIVSKNASHHVKSQGVVQMILHGTQDQEPQSITLGELSQHKEHRLGFKYFQQIEGEITLPNGFTPERVSVKVVPDSKKVAKLEKSFIFTTRPNPMIG